MSYPVRTSKEALRNTIFDYLPIGPAPCNEKCMSAGGSTQQSRLECEAYIEQLIRKYGQPAGNASFFILESNHDFGIYYEAAICFDFNDEEGEKYACTVENGDEYWDGPSLRKVQAMNDQHPTR